MNGARILIETLAENGVDTIFGYPGGAVLNIYDELSAFKDRIRHILVSHEQHAVHAADGYARVTGKAGVCLATSGPGATNLVTGLATAFADSVPVVAITGNVAIGQLGKDCFQEVDIAGITMPVVKHNWIVKDARDLAEIVREAFFVALSGRPGPVLIDIPADVCKGSGQWTVDSGQRAGRLFEKNRRHTFRNEDIDRAVLLIKDSKRPLIFAGGGVNNSGAGEDLKKFAELLNAPVTLSLMGMGAFPSEHPLCTGLVGKHGTVASAKALQNADLIIAIGARFSDRVINGRNFAKNAKILHVDIDPAEINKNILTDAFIIGDLKTVLNTLTCGLIKKLPAKKSAQWTGEMEKYKTQGYKTSARFLHPRFIIQETAKVSGENTIVATDVGQHQIWTAQFYPFKKPRSFLSSGGMGTMGYGLGAAIGAKIASPASAVVLFTGDGSFCMNSAEMATLVKYKLPVLIIVFNNSTLGMLRLWQKKSFSANYYETDLENPDFVKLADAYGIQGFRVTDEKSFLQALEKSRGILASGKPALIEVIINKNIT
ncbi:MAG: biosynthetic-type acetolactate synthase large subunit [Treponema sp.]|nr:biosynthetic-type acetolactate synthase large subunit [Treponema sp.]